MSENTGGAAAPVGEITGAATDGGVQRAAVAPTPELNADQRAAMVEVSRLRGEFGKVPHIERDAALKKIGALSRYALENGPKPADFLAEKNPAPDMRPYGGGLTAKLEGEAQPMSDQQAERLTAKAKVQGLAPDFAQRAVETTRALGLDEANASTILSRIAKHHGGERGESDFHRMDETETAEFMQEAGRLMGGADRLEAASVQARAFLESKGVLAEWDRLGITRSTLAMDPRVLIALCSAADCAGIPRG